MTATNRELEIKNIVGAKLEPLGWSLASEKDSRITVAVASKDYETSVGSQSAHIILDRVDDGEWLFLKAIYYSGARNVLSEVNLTITEEISEGVIEERLGIFLEAIERRINETSTRACCA